MKKKVILSVCFAISLLPMLLNQYGGAKGVQEITGLINLLNPIGILSVLLYFAGMWIKNGSRVLCVLGTVGMVVAELYKFLTWHVMTITGEISLQNSFALAFPEFYLGLAVSVMMIVVYLIADRKTSLL